jgi:hypothetical protein
MSPKTSRHAKKSTQNNRSKKSPVPNPDAVQMVENMISNEKGADSKKKLWKVLSKQMPHKTFTAVLDYLEKSNKIMYSKDGAIMWLSIENNPKLMKLHRTSVILR